MVMIDCRKELARCREMATRAESAGDTDRAIRALRKAVDLLRAITDEDVDPVLWRVQGEICSRLGELLWELHLPEAVQSFQEAVDAYEQEPDPAKSAQCARRVVEGVKLLRSRPSQRLDLLIARHDRDLRDLSQHDDSEVHRAHLHFKVATILQRRDRFAEAAGRYCRSLELYRTVQGAELNEAMCHHRLGDLHNRELPDDALAAEHYRSAIALYAGTEDHSEGEQMNRALCEWHLREVETRLAGKRPG